MQHKRQSSKLGVFLGLLLVVIVGGTLALMAVDVPSPQKAIEQNIDAKTLSDAKP